MLNETKFDNNFISEIKKCIINFISRQGINVSKITYNLSLYTKFVINNSDNNIISVEDPIVKDGRVIPGIITIDQSFFDVADNSYYIKPELEDIFTNKLLYIFIMSSRIDVKFYGNNPKSLTLNKPLFGFYEAYTECLAEDINDYVIPDFADPYAFNKKIVRMITAIVGNKHVLNSYLKFDDSLNVLVYSLSSDTELFKIINKLLTSISLLTNTLESSDAIITSKEEDIVKKAISNYKHRLVNIIISELYIPFINSVGLDNRKDVRNKILKGFLGANYTNLKLNDKNKNSYYWASLINNTVPINNKVSDNAILLLNTQIIKENKDNTHKLYIMAAQNKAKNNIKEFFVFNEQNKTYIKTGDRKITAPSLVQEILSYAYINNIDDETRKKFDAGIIKLCEKGPKFQCTLGGNPLDRKTMVAGIVKIARKNGYILSIDPESKPTKYVFDVKKEKETK